MDAEKSARPGWEVNQVKQAVRLGGWSLASGGTWAVAVLGSQFIWDGNRTVSAIAIAINVIVGFGLMRVHRDYLRCLDEMQQRVYLESMGLALAVGLEAVLVYLALALTNVIALRADFALLGIAALMILTHLGGVIYGNFWRFR